MSTRTPELNKNIKIRKAESIAYNSGRSTIYEFNEVGDKIIRLIDGGRTEEDITSAFIASSDEKYPIIMQKIKEFLERCHNSGIILWKKP